jgi:DNA-nicking Smr family endonuclease
MSRKPFEIRDHGLWDDIRRSIKPLRPNEPLLPIAAMALAAPNHGPVAKPTSRSTALPRSERHAPPPLGSFDRRTAQKLSRGQMEPDARIDLHGEGVETARMHLFHFLEQQRRHGARLVLVITGKGTSPYARHTLHGLTEFHSPERNGRLRREVPAWLHEDIFRAHVIGYQPAHPRHGGGGAIYVRLRQNGGAP